MKYKGDTTDADRPTIRLNMPCRRYSICIRNICLMYTITAYTITYSEYFLYIWSTRLQSIYTNMVGRAAAVVSPLYSLLLTLPSYCSFLVLNETPVPLNWKQFYLKTSLKNWYLKCFLILIFINPINIKRFMSWMLLNV